MAPKKLLVADDSLTIQKVIRLALSNEGYEIQAISDGADAIQQISTFRPDAILIDVSLPTRSAFEIKREVNGMSDHAATRFVLMSSAFEKIDEAQMDEVGFDGHLTKPFDPAHLRQVLLEVLTAPPVPHSPAPAEFQAAPPLPPTPSPPPPLLPSEPVSHSILLEPPSDLPPSDFEIAEATQPHFSIDPPEIPPALPEHKAPAPPSAPITIEDELWGKDEQTQSHFPAPGESPPASPMSDFMSNQTDPSNRDEIRVLTESTIRLSGLADLQQINSQDFDWTINEPSMKPPTSFADVGESSFQIAPPPYPDQVDAPSRMQPGEMPPGMPPRMPGMPGASEISPPSMPAMEDAIRLQIQQTLEKMAREILPDLAERVIKAEISKLLNEKF